MTSPSQQGRVSVLDRLGQAKRIWEILIWLIQAGVVVVGFVKSAGGPVQVLVEIGFFGFACYIAVWVVVPAVFFVLNALETAANRQTTDVAAALVAGVAVLGGGALIRFGLFAPRVTEGLDAIGIAFGALVGLAVLLVPFIVLWYLHGSRPRVIPG